MDGTLTPTPLMNRSQVASYLGVPQRTLDTWRRRQTGPPAIRVGRHLRWRLADVDQWLHDQTETHDGR